MSQPAATAPGVQGCETKKAAFLYCDLVECTEIGTRFLERQDSFLFEDCGAHEGPRLVGNRNLLDLGEGVVDDDFAATKE